MVLSGSSCWGPVVGLVGDLPFAIRKRPDCNVLSR
jgi:hypothetical protein